MFNRRSLILLLLWLGASAPLEASSAKIIKVLPHFLDNEGRHSLSPSLYERDAYQALLRNNPSRRSGLRFDIQWKAKQSKAPHVILRIELRGSKAPLDKALVLEQIVKPKRLFSSWSALTLSEEVYEKLGDLSAWRTTLWDGDQLLAELKSFLW